MRLDLIKFHCATRNYEPIESVYYDADGVQQHVRHYQRELFYIIPGSLSEQVLETVCKTK